jgi:hypothetical protein
MTISSTFFVDLVVQVVNVDRVIWSDIHDEVHTITVCSLRVKAEDFLG